MATTPEGLALKAYSTDLRDRVLADSDAGMATDDVAARYRVSASWVRRLKQRRRETGATTPRPQRHGPLPTWLAHAERIAGAVRDTPDATPEEHRRKLDAGLSTSSLWRGIKALGLTVKKKS
jgi:transposase